MFTCLLRAHLLVQNAYPTLEIEHCDSLIRDGLMELWQQLNAGDARKPRQPPRFDFNAPPSRQPRRL
jgi:hypothetical protein